MAQVTQLLTSRRAVLASTFFLSCLLASESFAECSRSSFWEPPACYNLRFYNYPFGPQIDARDCAHPSGKNCYYPKKFTARNTCNYDVKVRVVVNNGDDEIFTLKPGGSRAAKAYQHKNHQGDGEDAESAYFRWWTCCREGNAQCRQ